MSSQLGQDKWVLDKLGHKTRGTFVEIGGHDGVRHSNSLALERDYLWTGLLVEPNPVLFEKCVASRPNCQHARVAVSDGYGSSSFFMGDSYGGLVHTMPKKWKVEHVRRGNPVEVVETVPLDHLLVQHKMPRFIDYLSLDVEGAEYAILSKFLAGKPKFAFNCLTVEFRYDMLLLERLNELLTANGYRLDTIMAFDACYTHSTLC